MNKRHPQNEQPTHSGSHKTASAISKICVYCGSGYGLKEAYKNAADALGADLARNGIGLVYGGGGLGLMGEVARATLAEGGHVTGIMPHFLSEREKQLPGLQDLVLVKNMHQRKMEMFERSDAFVALPGGIGTLEELVEQLTWAQLGQHRKPVIIANIEGFWDPLLLLIEHMREETFIRDGMEVNISVVTRAEDIIPKIKELTLSAALGEQEPLDFTSQF